MYNTNIKNLLTWYSRNRREMPWRKTQDPYKIWISEIMLQQTQVKTVIPYYKKWIKKYPTINHVVCASEKTLLKSWEGLGYYRRCRNFHTASKIVENKFDGIPPSDYQIFKSLPGVGDYTASAVMSICFNEFYPVLDANVKRVLARIMKIKKFTAKNIIRIKKTLDLWISAVNNPGDFNQAMMELGSQICIPKKPNCLNCPLSDLCLAFITKSPEKYPAQLKLKKIPTYDVSVGIIWDNDKFYIQRRENKLHLGGMWELPGGKRKLNERLDTTVAREIQEECNIKVIVKSQAGFVKHQYTHFKINLSAYHCNLSNGNSIPITKNTKWIKQKDINSFPFPKATLKIFDQSLSC
ncbi:MAG: A/G-specific adenine glycosylase [Candidatus Marinimicrobia bacterium]|jgi:A/G-specific adenine glycosylase|nr:A/G-specific adenine glycosylase [Candidatus Neomarinimicrobiota bacterium]MBT3617394.1 A/G-specific adenine glycosylase [Candidatus Neomarinimicrobiota bacterium]MBT3998292.1 A/G-specific adenine glycosylase [Candidatus Neomarinimicrobiota bacterium]MBT4795809.1 A/G-specific adenine glycosylase [Candidatus Neomarinimicrobiota bacterium]MBT5340347.1 A/G-specific adenine glycosylase [Candidatus Neomarinimicrobiota bacterium]